MKEPETISEAMRLHRAGEPEKAIEAYKIALKKHPKDKRLYANLAALNRAQGKPEAAAHVAQEGLQLCDPNSPMLLNTLGNALRDLNRQPEAINCYRRALKETPEYFDAQFSLLLCLEDLKYKSLANLMLGVLIRRHGPNNQMLANRIIMREAEEASNENRKLHPTVELWMQRIQKQAAKEDNPKAPDHWFQVAQICCSFNRIEDARHFHKKGIEALASYRSLPNKMLSDDQLINIQHVSSWNLGCALLRAGDLKMGWKLYDHGLRAPAEGAQRWQRSLYKPFSLARVPIWRGENLKGKRLLLLGEQGIGDSMMFITCVPTLIREGAIISLVVPQRLKDIYTRSLTQCKVLGEKDMREEEAPLPEEYDLQCPLGSILQFRFTSLEDYGQDAALLKPNSQRVKILRERYGADKPLIGISWQGGGKGKRIDQKSINLGQLCGALKTLPARFLSLQYGDDAEMVSRSVKKHQIDLIDDPEIQAISDMDDWLNQVASCDAIISVANTTIHGAGGLGKPTLCLLGAKPDWRWLADESQTHSYWYPTVEIAKQEQKPQEWIPALESIPNWWKKQQIQASQG